MPLDKSASTISEQAFTIAQNSINEKLIIKLVEYLKNAPPVEFVFTSAVILIVGAVIIKFVYEILTD